MYNHIHRVNIQYIIIYTAGSTYNIFSYTQGKVFFGGARGMSHSADVVEVPTVKSQESQVDRRGIASRYYLLRF